MILGESVHFKAKSKMGLHEVLSTLFVNQSSRLQEKMGHHKARCATASIGIIAGIYLGISLDSTPIGDILLMLNFGL